MQAHAHDLYLTLADFAFDVHSGFGEDGIIAEIHRRLPPSGRRYVELGAPEPAGWSSTRHLAEQGWVAAPDDDVDLLAVSADAAGAAWPAIAFRRPRVVVAGFHPTDPSSAPAAVALAADQGYRLAATTAVTLIFVRDDLHPFLGIEDHSLEALRQEHSWELTPHLSQPARHRQVHRGGAGWPGRPLNGHGC